MKLLNNTSAMRIMCMGKQKDMIYIGNIVVHVLNNKRLFVNRDADSYSSKNNLVFFKFSKKKMS
jgi:hypothetical protein